VPAFFDRRERLENETAEHARGFLAAGKPRIDFPGILLEKTGICAVIDIMNSAC